MNPAQRALLARLRELVQETPGSGALDAGKKPYHPSRFAQAVERRADDGPALAEYVRAKAHKRATDGYDALIAAGRADLTVEALVADETAPWAPEFTEADRAAARLRLGTLLRADRTRRLAEEAEAVKGDKQIVGVMNRKRTARGEARLSAKQEAEVRARLAGKRT